MQLPFSTITEYQAPADLNAITTPGIYVADSNTSNRPDSDLYIVLCYMFSSGYLNFGVQIAVVTASTKAFIRTQWGANWNAWLEIG